LIILTYYLLDPHARWVTLVSVLFVKICLLESLLKVGFLLASRLCGMGCLFERFLEWFVFLGGLFL